MFLLVSVSAIYSGETITYDFSDKTQEIISLNYSVINGSSGWFDINFNGTKVFVNPNIYLETGEYTIIFEINGQTEVHTPSGGGGSNSKSYYTWNCSSWGDCTNGFVSRNCIKQKVYYKTILGDKPDEYLECEKMNIIETKNEEKDSISPDPIEIPKKMSFIKVFSWILIIIVLSLLAYFLNVKRKELKNKQLKENSIDLSEKVQNDKN